MPSRIRIILLDFTRNGTRVTYRNREVETKEEINGERERETWRKRKKEKKTKKEINGEGERHGETERTKDVETRTHTHRERNERSGCYSYISASWWVVLLILIEVLFSDLISLSKICTVR